MRYPAGHKQATRSRILAAAGRRFRERGYRGAGVDEVMATAGLTAGGFYAHFASKEELLAGALAEALGQTRQTLLQGLDEQQGAEWLRSVIGRYLSRSHRDAPAEGCALPALCADVARAGEGPRRVLESHVRAMVAELAPKTPAGPGLAPDERALATLALALGGLLLARAVHDADLSERVLRSCRRLAVPEAAAQPAAPDER